MCKWLEMVSLEFLRTLVLGMLVMMVNDINQLQGGSVDEGRLQCLPKRLMKVQRALVSHIYSVLVNQKIGRYGNTYHSGKVSYSTSHSQPNPIAATIYVW